MPPIEHADSDRIKLMRIFSVVLLALAAMLSLAAQENPEFVAWMKATKASMDSFKEAKTGPKAMASAEKLGSVYENMTGFWRQRNAADAVKISEDGKAAAAMLASAAHAEDMEKADAALKTLGGTCKACHDAHREKNAEGKYQIK